MSFDDCYQLGTVVKTHGLKGELVFFLDVDHPAEYKNLESVFIEINGKLIPFFMNSIKLKGERAIVSLEDVDDIDSAKALTGKTLYLPLRKLPELKNGQYYYHQLIGFDVFNEEEFLGKVTGVFQMPNNHLLGVDHQGVEVLIPMQKEIMLEVRVSEGKVITRLPDGLLDVYLNP